MVDHHPQVQGDIRRISASDGATLEYEVVGLGPPVVMLHGFLANRFTFTRQRSELASHFRLILPNLRGSAGCCDAVPPNYGPATSDVDDLRAVLDAEKLDRVSLLGHSSGGATAFVFAVHAPDRVERSVLIEPTLYPALPSADRARLSAENSEIRAVCESQGPAAGLRACVASVGGDAWSKLDAKTQADRLQSLSSSAPFVRSHLLGLNTLPVTEADVTDFKAPALLLYGADSFWFESIIRDQLRIMRPDFRVVTIENAAHNVHRDRPDIVNAEVLAFIPK